MQKTQIAACLTLLRGQRHSLPTSQAEAAGRSLPPSSTKHRTSAGSAACSPDALPELAVSSTAAPAWRSRAMTSASKPGESGGDLGSAWEP